MATRSERRIHPGVYEAQDQLRKGRISRREFLRLATLLGVSAGSAYVMAACGIPAAPTAVAPAPVGEQIKRGGVLRSGMQVPAVDHPARFSWAFDANEFRMVFEYLAETGKDNLTRPYLLERWEASDDLKTWTLHLRQGIKWTNGDDFVADHVKFNFNEWLNPDVGSSILGLWEGFLTINDVEVVDNSTVRLHLANPKLDVPENLFHYPAQIMHPSFNGDITSGRNPSTGPYTLAEYRVGERVKVVRREGYWQNGADGQPLPYLDSIEYIDLGDDQTAYVAAVEAGQLDHIHDVRVETFLALRNSPRAVVTSVGTSQVRVLRFRVDLEPWSDNRVRLAVKKLQNRQKILDQAYFGEGLVGHDTHVSPVHPEFAPMDVPAYDPDGARQLLQEAGQAGLSFDIAVGTGWTDVVSYAETLAEDAKAAGVNITLNTMPNNSYWDLWTEAAVGITPWTHRPLAVMVLPLAYIGDAQGNPVPWNESRWVDAEFTQLLQRAQGTLDIEARRAIMRDIQRIQSERGSVGIAFWRNVWGVFNPAFQGPGAEAHPTDYNLWREVWYDPDKDPNRS
jgi:peptide/nickel transport system substrate-binding protein